MRIAVWSGPRNLSTALMYSFGNRADMTAVDEPFYGAFLKDTGIDHPMADETMASMECDPSKVAGLLRSYNTSYQYEKHMLHHMLPDFPLDWMDEAVNVFLIRHPARVLASYVQKREEPTANDLGFTQLDTVMARAKDPIIVDSADIRQNPERTLQALCAAIGIPFDSAMIRWPQGPKPFDGIWAQHWYDAVHKSSQFAGPEGDVPPVPKPYTKLIETARTQYEELRAKSV